MLTRSKLTVDLLNRNMSSKVEIMGILNLTPNSFSDGGKFISRLDATKHFERLVHAGADIIDVGAVATGVGSALITTEEEILRLELIFGESFINSYRTKISVSVDTYSSKVAKYVLERGASIINDISAFRADPKMVEIVSQAKSYVVLMYSRKGKKFPHASSEPFEYDSIIDEIVDFFEERINYACSNGVDESKIILDPGMGGFLSPNTKYSWEVVRNSRVFKERFRNFKILYGVSRKKFINEVSGALDLDSSTKLVELELSKAGVDIIRTHDVQMLKSSVELIRNMEFKD